MEDSGKKPIKGGDVGETIGGAINKYVGQPAANLVQGTFAKYAATEQMLGILNRFGAGASTIAGIAGAVSAIAHFFGFKEFAADLKRSAANMASQMAMLDRDVAAESEDIKADPNLAPRTSNIMERAENVTSNLAHTAAGAVVAFDPTGWGANAIVVGDNATDIAEHWQKGEYASAGLRGIRGVFETGVGTGWVPLLGNFTRAAGAGISEALRWGGNLIGLETDKTMVRKGAEGLYGLATEFSDAHDGPDTGGGAATPAQPRVHAGTQPAARP